MPCSLPFWRALALSRGAVRGATVSETVPFQQVTARRLKKETATVMNRVFGEIDGMEEEKQWEPSESLPTTKGELAAWWCQELDAPLTRQARHFPSHSLATQR